MPAPVRKAVFPVAGLGTRFLPATKAIPKEMLTVVDKPLIQYAFEEAAAAGIEEFIFVTGRGKQALEDHFDLAFELKATLEARGKSLELDQILGFLPPAGAVKYVRQTQALGLGHAIWCARDMIGDEPFAILSPDDLVLSNTPCLKQLVDAHGRTGGNVVAVMDVPRDQTARYGIVSSPDPGADLVEIDGLVEKPDPEVAPSTLSIIGRYVLDAAVFPHLDRHETGAGGEIQLTDAMAKLIGSRPFHGLRFEGERFDCGTKQGWLAANMAFALTRPDMADAARAIVARHAAR
jgi:UTP--glucose-1-phosphate uridylyltransferase